MAAATNTLTNSGPDDGERAGAEIVYGNEDCQKHSLELLEEMGFPRGVLPLKDLVECGRVRATGFVWMKQKAASKHYFEKSKTLVSYGEEVTAYVEKHRMKRMNGVKSKQVLLWVTISEMIIEDPARRKICFRTPLGLGKTFPITAFMTDEEEKKFLESKPESESASESGEEENNMTTTTTADHDQPQKIEQPLNN
ncbi:hypothetical protein Dimus_008986 [Dionaea muscipula]